MKLINLIPSKEKRELRLVRAKQLTIVLGNMIVIVLVCLVLVIFFLKFYLLTQTAYQKAILETVQQKYETADFMKFKKLIQKFNGIYAQSFSFYKNQTYFSSILKMISEIEKPSGVLVSSIVATKEKDGKIKVGVSGTSVSRDSLLAFKDRIEKKSLSETGREIENIYFSPESWIKPKDIVFNVTFDIK